MVSSQYQSLRRTVLKLDPEWLVTRLEESVSVAAIVSLALVFMAFGATQEKGSPGGEQVRTISTAKEESVPFEMGDNSPSPSRRKDPADFKLLSYNIRWRGGEDLQKLIKLFREDHKIGNASILALQEVDRNKKRTKNVNTIKQLANELGYYYAWTAPPREKSATEEETGVALLSVYPLADVRRIVLPHEGPNQRRRVALGATIELAGVRTRVYSVHSETRIALDKKLEQMSAVIQDLVQYPAQMPAVILGDLNTWEPAAGSKVTKLFTGASFNTPFGNETTFSRKILFVPLDLRLDWVWLRGLQTVSCGIDRDVAISDHFPLWINIKFPRVRP